MTQEPKNFTVEDWIAKLKTFDPKLILYVKDGNWSRVLDTSYVEPVTVPISDGDDNEEKVCNGLRINVPKVNPVTSVDAFVESKFFEATIQNFKERALKDEELMEKDMFELIEEFLKHMGNITASSKVYFFPDSGRILIEDELSFPESLEKEQLFSQYKDSCIWIGRVSYDDFSTFAKNPIEYLLQNTIHTFPYADIAVAETTYAGLSKNPETP